jgi:hypothetical protein
MLSSQPPKELKEREKKHQPTGPGSGLQQFHMHALPPTSPRGSGGSATAVPLRITVEPPTPVSTNPMAQPLPQAGAGNQTSGQTEPVKTMQLKFS